MSYRLFYRPIVAAILLAALMVVLAGCGSEQGSQSGNGAEQQAGEGSAGHEHGGSGDSPPAPEPAESPPLDEEPAGEVVEVGSGPEGLIADPETGLVAVGLRDPDELALVDGGTGEVVETVDLPEKARHLALAAPGGPVLVPSERSNSLVQVSLAGEVVEETPVGEFPHDAAAYGDRVFVLNEFESTAAAIEDGEVVETFETPFQPGGIAATPDGLLGVVGVRGLDLEVFEADTLDSLGRVEAGEGPTHIVAGPGGRFYVTDTRGDAVLVYEAGTEPSETGRIPLPGGAPYGIALDPERNQLWVTLTAENRVVRYALDGEEPRRLDGYPTLRQPNNVAVNPRTGRVFVTGTHGGELQILDPQ